MTPTLIKIRCEGCRRTKVIGIWPGAEEDQDMLEAGECVERKCTTCGGVTDHEVLDEAA